MNNTKNILLVALITATLVLGTSVIPLQSYADENKNTKDPKHSIKASTVLDKNSASQKLDQDNFCYRGDDCQQANQGQQIVGKDNDAKGFNDQIALESVDNQGQPGPAGPECPSGFAFNAGTQQCERPTTTQATCPDGSAATSATCPGTTTNVPAICPDGFTGPSSTGTCTGPVQRIPGTCPDPIGATIVTQGPYINNQGQCEIVIGEGAIASNYPNCFGMFSKTCMDGLFVCPDGFTPFDLVTGTCAGSPTTQATCPDGSAATSATCPVTGPTTQAICPAGFTGPDATGRCTGTETGTIQCANPTSTGVCQTSPRF